MGVRRRVWMRVQMMRKGGVCHLLLLRDRMLLILLLLQHSMHVRQRMRLR